MNRRKFIGEMVRFGAFLTAVSSPLILSSCSQSKKGIPEDNSDFLRIGILSDTHGHGKNSEFFVNEMENLGVEIYLMPGDLSHSFGDYEGAKDDSKEISAVIEPVAETKKPVLVIPGNHESRRDYNSTILKLQSKYSNIIDGEKNPAVQLEGSDLIIAMYGGKDNPNYTVPNGFIRSGNDFFKFGEKVKPQKPILLATHVPRRYINKNGLDVIGSGLNVGAMPLNHVVGGALNVKYTVSGDIHEAFGILTHGEEKLKEGTLSDRVDFNPGAVFDHVGNRGLKPSAGILDVNSNQARAYFLRK
ncbi:metallophosphoesterase [Nanoarchaeota archaeon]